MDFNIPFMSYRKFATVGSLVLLVLSIGSLGLKGLNLGCSGIITATCNVTSALARKVYDDFCDKKEQTSDQKLCDIRNVFEKYNLISALHSYYSKTNGIYKNVLPPLSILKSQDEKDLINELEKLNFLTNSTMVA